MSDAFWAIVNINYTKQSTEMQPKMRIYSVYNGIQVRILLYTINKNEKVMEDLSPFTQLGWLWAVAVTQPRRQSEFWARQPVRLDEIDLQ